MTSANSAPAVKLGDELTVSAIGFGAMALTPVYGEVDDVESLATLNRTLDLGVTFIDTANIYGNGNNEKLIAKLLADRRGAERVVDLEPRRRTQRRTRGGRTRRRLCAVFASWARVLDGNDQLGRGSVADGLPSQDAAVRRECPRCQSRSC